MPRRRVSVRVSPLPRLTKVGLVKGNRLATKRKAVLY